MVDHTLHGNGTPCPGCALRREEMMPHAVDALGNPARDLRAFFVECQLCDGWGILPRRAEDIVADHVAWARAHYWPALRKKWGIK